MNPLQIIQKRIHTIRGMQVMLDRDLAEFYGVETKVLNQAVKRNSERFPEMFMFQLTQDEADSLRSQFVTSKDTFLRSQNVTLDESVWRSHFAISKGKGGRRYLPYVFTEQGVAMLSAVLKSGAAVRVSIQIMNAFVAMRKLMASHHRVLPRLENLERRQIRHEIETDQKFERVFTALEGADKRPVQGIFFDGQVFDAYRFVSDIIRRANKSIVLIDNYVDDSVLTLLGKRKSRVSALILTRTVSKQLILDLEKHNAQYPPVKIRVFKNSHVRFLIIDEEEVYHIGASLKDLGRKWFAFSRLDKEALKIMDKVRENI